MDQSNHQEAQQLLHCYLRFAMVCMYMNDREVKVRLTSQIVDEIFPLHCCRGHHRIIDLSIEAPQPQPVPLGLSVRYLEVALLA